MTDAAPETNAAAPAQEPATNPGVPPLDAGNAVPVPDADHTPEQRAAALEAMGNAAGGASSAEQKPEVGSASAAPAGESADDLGNGEPVQAPAATSATDSATTAVTMPLGSSVSSPASAAGEAPNDASGAADASPNADGSATNADGAITSSPIVASSAADVPLHVRVAHHLEAIFQLTKSEVEAPARSLSQEAVELKAHIAETLHKVHNGISVSEGVLVQKLEAILRLL